VERTLNSEGSESQTVALDLANVTFVDREAMVFLCSAKAKNIAIENCPSYVIRWIQQERLCAALPAMIRSEPNPRNHKIPRDRS